MGDIGSAISGGMNSVASIYNNNRNIAMQRETNALNYQMSKENNQFAHDEGEFSREFNWNSQQEAQRFGAEQTDLNRQFQSDEAEKARQWQEDMYNKYQSPTALASQYERLGINPSAVLGGNTGSFNSTSFPTGGAASGSPVSSSPVSPSGAIPMQAPQSTQNPISAFLEAFQSSQRTQAEVQATKLKNEYQKTENKFATRQFIADLKERNARIDKLLEDKKTTEEQRKKLETDRRQNEFQIKILESSWQDMAEMNKQERIKAENENKSLVLQHANMEIQNQWLPKLLSSQYNLNDSEAQAALKSAQAALEQAFAARYDATTKRAQYNFDVKKFNSVFRENMEAATRDLNASAEMKETENSHYTANKVYQISHDAVGDIGKMLMTLIGFYGLGKMNVKNGKLPDTSSSGYYGSGNATMPIDYSY